MKKNYFFIGDLHGCADELEGLLEKIKSYQFTKIICVGDLVNKGPKSNKVVTLLRKEKILSVMGNHDYIIKTIYNELKNGEKPSLRIKKKHYKLYKTLSEKNIAYICNLPFYIRLDDIKTIVVHGGIKPNTALEDNTIEELSCIRRVEPITKAFVSGNQKGFPWYFYYTGKYCVVYGHNASGSIQMNKNTVGIDTGCVYGNKLSAYCLPDNFFLSFPAKKIYKDYTQNGKYKMPR